MKLLVTGGAGFIGSEFVRQAVEKGIKLSIIDKLTYAGDLARIRTAKESYELFEIDLSNAENVEKVVKKVQPDVVVHFAAETHVDRSILDGTPFINSNVLGTFNLINSLKDLSRLRKYIHISTDEVYGALGAEGQFTEDSPLEPNSPYSASKASADHFVQSFVRTFDLPAIIARPSNNYGPWQYPEKLIPVIITKAMMDEEVPVYAEGKNVREWLFVSDCAEGIWSIVDKGKVGETYNIGSGLDNERQNIDVVKFILGILGKPESLIKFVKDRPGHDFRYSITIDKISNATGWKPETDFEEGMKKTVEWYSSNQEWLDKKKKELEVYWKTVYQEK